MDIRWLQDFLILAEMRNFSRAAECRNVSQAAFSRRIKALESWLGVILIDRSVFPTKLTPQGEVFRGYATDIIQNVSDARVDLSGHMAPKRSEVRIALPHALATGWLPSRVLEWSKSCNVNFGVVTGNVHDTVTAFVSGDVDILIAFHNLQQPIHLASEQYERVIVGEDILRPYCTRTLRDRLASPWPGTSRNPIPVLMYSPGAYLARMVELIVANAPSTMHGVTILENDMADVLRETASVSIGVAWLPNCTAKHDVELLPLGGDIWSLPLSVMAYRDKSNRRATVRRLWDRLGDQQLQSLAHLSDAMRCVATVRVCDLVCMRWERTGLKVWRYQMTTILRARRPLSWSPGSGISQTGQGFGKEFPGYARQGWRAESAPRLSH